MKSLKKSVDGVVVSLEVKAGAVKVITSIDELGLVDVLNKNREETLALVHLILESAGINADINILPEVTNVGVSDEKLLGVEKKEELLGVLEERFVNNMNLHEGCDWQQVKLALEANTDALWSINEMELAGHMPDVYNFDETGFDIGTCSKEIPKEGRNCVYDSKAAMWVRQNYPTEVFNGNAVDFAVVMGVDLMSDEDYEVLQSKGKFDTQTWSWLLKDEDQSFAGRALYGYFADGQVVFDHSVGNMHRANGGWRGTLRVLWI